MGITKSIDYSPRTYWHISEGKFNKWLELAKENGINENTFYSRVHNEWDPKDAATIPARKLNDRKDLVKIAEENGISASTFRSRVNSYGWDPMKAATTKPKIKRTKENIS